MMTSNIFSDTKCGCRQRKRRAMKMAKRLPPAVRAGLALTIGSGVSVALGAPVLTTLDSFNGTDGSLPFCTMAIDSSGDLFGTTTQSNFGSAIASGTVFELKAGNLGTVDTLASFNVSNGSRPQGAVAIDSVGDVFGATSSGGSSNVGVVFDVSAGTGKITDLAGFNGSSGSNPDGGVTFDGVGNVYGTTYSAGGSGLGTVFKVPITGVTSDPTLIRFNGSNGASPLGRLAIDSAGDVYGTTTGIGNGTNGTVWEIAAATNVFTTLATFNSSNGTNPGDLTVDSSGNLYGVTAGGGASGDGTVFKIANGSGAITTLATFTGYNGETPKSGVIVDASGNLFGATSTGGGTGGVGQVTGDGTVYEVVAGSNAVTTLVAFNGSNGSSPFGGLTADSSGNLYGTTDMGGNNSEGTIFELTGSGYVVGPQPIFVGSGQTYHFTINPGTGILVRTVPGVTIASTGIAIADPTANHSNRQLLEITGTGLTLAGTMNGWTGKFDLGNNDLDLPGASLSTVTNQVQQGYAFGTWNGSGGITSASAAANSSHLTALGVIQNNQSGSPLYSSFDGATVGASDILVKYTYYGDANLDGKVDASDYSLIDDGYVRKLTGWYNGDFNYDGLINGSDYTLIDNAFNTQGVQLTTELATSTAEVFDIDSVPEPAAAVLLSIAGIAGLGRRKRQQPKNLCC